MCYTQVTQTCQSRWSLQKIPSQTATVCAAEGKTTWLVLSGYNHSLRFYNFLKNIHHQLPLSVISLETLKVEVEKQS